MTKSEWRKSKDGAALLAVVADRLTPRKWALLACSVARRALPLLPDKPFQDAVDWAERHADAAGVAAMERWRQLLEDGVQDARSEAEQKQLAVVRACDPDAFDGPIPDDDDTEPSVIVFRGASHLAGRSVAAARAAAESAAAAVRFLFDDDRAAGLEAVRRAVGEAQGVSAEAFIRGQVALDLLVRAERFADAPPARRRNVQLSVAHGLVNTADDEGDRREDQAVGQKQTAEASALAHLLREQLGNPFEAYPFEPAWRTETVVALATGIDAERAFDRMPILADALEEAGCDERAVLDHLRGPGPHARGCWVLDLILTRDPELFALPPLIPTPPRMPLGPFTPPAGDMA
jgi:hypothetical protein